MDEIECVRPEVFRAFQCMDFDKLSEFSEDDLRPILPALVRMTVIGAFDGEVFWLSKNRLFGCLLSVDAANGVTSLLSADFLSLDEDFSKEMQLCEKLGASAAEKNRDESPLLKDSTSFGDLCLDFERGDATRKLRLLLREIALAFCELNDVHVSLSPGKACDLFEEEIYADEVSDVLIAAMMEMPDSLSPSAVVPALFRRMADPSGLICRIVANLPHSFVDVCVSIITMNEKFDDENHVIGKARCTALLRLCQMNPTECLEVPGICIDLVRLPAAAVLIMLEASIQKFAVLPGDCAVDVVAFLSGALLSNNPAVKSLFSQWIKAGQRTIKRDCDPATVTGSPSFNALKSHLVGRVQGLLTKSMNNTLANESVDEGMAILRLYCLMKGHAAYKLTEDEALLVLKLVTSRPPATQKGGRFVSLGLCVMLACPALVGTAERERVVVQWIRWLVKDFHVEKSSYAELLLLMAILFHGNHLNAISDLVASTLCLKLPVKPGSMHRLKTVFTQEVFTEQVVASHAVRVAVTENLNARCSGFLPVHCIYHLVKSRVFSKHKVPIRDWVYRQLLCAVEPLHPILPQLVEVYVNSILIPPAARLGGEDEINDPFTIPQVLAVFHPNSEASSVSQLLMLYYLLLYENLRLNNMKPIMASKRTVLTYSRDLMAQVPVKYLLLKAQSEQEQYATLFPALMRLLMLHYPHLCLVEDWLHQLEPWESNRFKKYGGCAVRDPTRVKEMVADAFANLPKCPAKAIFLLKRLRQLSAAQLRPLADVIVSNAKLLLDSESHRVPRLAQDLFREVWRKISIVYPRAVWVIAVNSLASDVPNMASKELPIHPNFKQDDLTLDPLIVLRCDPRIFGCPPLFEIVLRVLRGYLAASRAMLQEHILDKPLLPQQLNQKPQGLSVAISSDAEREELKNALITAQDSAAVQLLLEITANRQLDSGGIGELRNSTEVQSLVCSHLHHVFIAEPHLVKLVHFQSYPRELLPMTATGIPSMHICLDFLPELVTTLDVDRLVFAITLLSHLSTQYALPKALSVTRLAISVIFTILSSLPGSVVLEEFLPIFPALVRLGVTFPPVLTDVVSFFIQYAQQAASIADVRSTRDNMILLPGPQPSDQLARQPGKPRSGDFRSSCIKCGKLFGFKMMSGQTLTDRLTAAKHSLAGQGLAKSVCKATTEEIIGPKKKHLDYLLACTNEPNVSIPQMANLLIERTTNASWVVVFKALITVHHLMCYGNERFTQYLASSNCTFQLSNFLDKTGTAGYDMSTYIRRYAKYLNEKALSYRTVAFDFCKVKRGKEDGTLRTMPTEKLLKTLPVLQNQLDSLLEFDCSASELTNGVINTAFMLLFRDLIRIFACYNDGIINLLEEYFEMNKKQCRDALDLYKKFLIRMDRVSEFLKTAEKVGLDRSEIPDLVKNVGVDKADIPDLSKAPSSLLDALESHLASLEGRKYVPQANGHSFETDLVDIVKSGLDLFISASAVNGGSTDDETLRLKALAEEEAALAAIKERHEAKHTNPFLASPTAESSPMTLAAHATAAPSSGNDILDLLDAPAPPAPAPVSKPSDDLLQLGGNPFADILASGANSSMPPNNAALGIFGGAPATGANSMVNPDSIWSTPSGLGPGMNSQFASEAGFAAAFGGSSASIPMTLAAHATAAPSSGNDILDLLDAPAPPAPAPVSKPSDDLLQLGGNPFADILASGANSSMPPNNAALGIFGGAPATGANSMVNPDSIWSTPSGLGPGMNSQFASEAGFAAAFGGSSASSFDAFGQMLQPVAVGQSAAAAANPAGMNSGAPSKPAQQKSLFSGDLDSTLASLADSLSIMPSSGAGKGWNSPAKQTQKPMAAAAGWSQPAAGAGVQGFRPMNPVGGPMGPTGNFMAGPATGNLLGSSDPFGAL
ncbi:unnamed protein product [Notodromas monacha]|uniref:ENTH domain-containing protein n=1 Tax=Notodromas monacha TaxID=399045 RepID=A0A7R9BH61_9CRUS|nr:unnamed protein product [Notodromas monacha]CAG0913825.1 unnamed protein product [Notodromas monacha]